MYINSHTLSDVPTPQSISLIDEIKKHMSDRGQNQVETGIEEERQRLGRTLVIITENHSAATRSSNLIRRLDILQE